MSSQRINRSAIHRTNPRTRPYLHRSCKRGGNSTTTTTTTTTTRSTTTIDSLPDELLFDVLVRISAQDLHQNARIVCKRWNRLIHGDAFASAHLHRTGYGLLFTTRRGVGGSNATFLAGTRGGGGIEESKVSCKLTSPIECSCNGLITGVDINKKPILLYIVNPATKRRFDLPRLLDAAEMRSFGIAYAAASMEYKVVATYLYDPDSKDLQYAILTVGVNKAWRRVSTQHLEYYQASWFLNTAPFITEGFMHWAYFDDYVVTMNVETEVIADTPTPLADEEYRAQGFENSYLSTGRNLSALVPCGKLLWEVWELKGETGEWSNLLLNIDCRSKIQQFGWNIDCSSKTQQFAWKDNVPPLKPVGWVKYPEVLLFSYDRSYLIYDLVNDEMEPAELASPVNDETKPGGRLGPPVTRVREAVVHKKSLVMLKLRRTVEGKKDFPIYVE